MGHREEPIVVIQGNAIPRLAEDCFIRVHIRLRLADGGESEAVTTSYEFKTCF